MLVRLYPFAQQYPAGVQDVEVDLSIHDGQLHLIYRVQADDGCIVWPASGGAERQDGLWQHTCFEVFIAAGNGYREYNFAPSGAWAAYDFTSYREGMMPAAVSPPEINMVAGTALKAVIDVPAPAARLAISAVIELRDGTRSYWALHHGADKPDFHHPDSFTLRLDSI